MRRRSLTFLLLGLIGLGLVSLTLLRALGSGSALELSREEFSRAELTFAGLASGSATEPPNGFTLQSVNDPLQALLVEEPPGSCRGGGSYFLRQEATAIPLLISAPHRSADRLTGTLTMRFFVEGRAQAAAWNSVPRRSACAEDESDIVRLDRHPFTAFTSAFARAHPNGRVVQVHGFDVGRRRTAEARAASVILSSGSRDISPTLEVIAACLRRDLPALNVALFPLDVSELGATRNAQGRSLRSLGFQGFVHAELSLELRRRLVEDAGLRQGFLACLEAGL